MKKARDTKFCMHIPMDFTYIFSKNYVSDILHLAYFQIWLKKAKIEILINYYQMKRIRNMFLGKHIFEDIFICCPKNICQTHLVHSELGLKVSH